MATAGRILIIPKGDYNDSVAYEMLDLVSYASATWLAKKDVIGIEPSDANSEYWFKFLGHSAINNLTTTRAGFVLDARQGKILMDAIARATAKTAEMEVEIDNALSIALGRNQSLSYNTYEEMVSVLNALETAELNCGQNIYIADIGIPDLWVYSVETEWVEYEYTDDDTIVEELKANGTIQIGYYKLAQLETQKVDLTDINDHLKIYKATLSAGATEVTIASEKINEDSILTFYASVYGVSPSDVVVEDGSVTLTFSAQETDMEVGVRVDG